MYGWTPVDVKCQHLSVNMDRYKNKKSVGFKVRHSPEGLIRLPYLLPIQCEGNLVTT